MKKDEGFIEYNTVLFLFFISVIIAGTVLYSSSAFSYQNADTRDFDNKKTADLLLDEIIEKIQPLKFYQYDDRHNPLIISLTAEYEKYNLKITDVSSGYHLDFLSDADLADTGITRLLFLDNTASAFLLWRNANGLSSSKEEWKVFVKQEAWEHIVCYGWVHKNNTSSFAFRTIAQDFGTTDTDKLFPLVNDFPVMNVNMVNPQILRPLIMRSSFSVERAGDKANTLITRLQGGSLTRSEIRSILNIPITHPLMAYMGSKTSFWEISFVMPSALEVKAVIAAIPEKNAAVQEIEKYVLIHRSFL